MGMRREPGFSCDAIFIEDAEGTKILECGVVVVCETEGVVGIQPPVVCVSSSGGTAGSDFCVRKGGHSFESFLDCGFEGIAHRKI
jgi:hypothetical protein